MPDREALICFIMAFFTYLTSSWSLHVYGERRWTLVPLALLKKRWDEAEYSGVF